MKKSVLLVTLSVLTSVVLTGCGEDRSHPKDSAVVHSGQVNKKIPFITETAKGKVMRNNHFVYIPGEFDVDGDGVKEGGFWISEYEARDVAGADLNMTADSNISAIIKNNFKAFDGTGFGVDINTSTYKNVSATDAGLSTIKVTFDNNTPSQNNISALGAILSLKHSQITDGYAFSLPLEKQWMQLVKLAINNPQNWTGGVGTGVLKEDLVFANGLLGNDTNVDANYTVTVHELSGGLSEWTRGVFKASDRIAGANIQAYQDINSSKIPTWWLPKLKDANTTLSTVGGYYGGVGTSPLEDQNTNLNGNNNGAYAVTARGGVQLDRKLSAALVQYGFGSKTNDFGFRGASVYIKPSHYPYEVQ